MRAQILYIILVGVFLTGAPYVMANAAPPDIEPVILDGLVFVGHVGPVGQAANGEDEIVFQDGQFLSTSCVEYGFGSAPYEARREGDVIIFNAIVKSQKHGQIDWQGKIRGEDVEASFTWTKDRWYWFDANEESWLKARLRKDR